MCIATAVIYAWRQVSGQEPQYCRMYVWIHAEHILWCSVGAGVRFYLFIYLFFMEEELTVLSTKFWNVRNGRVRMTEATISRSTHKHNEGEQGGTVQASPASSGQSASELLTCEQQSTLLGWNKYQIRHHTSAYCLYLFSLPSSVFLHPFLFTFFYPSPTLYSSELLLMGG